MNGYAIMVFLILGFAATAPALIQIVREHRSLSERAITTGIILRLYIGLGYLLGPVVMAAVYR